MKFWNKFITKKISHPAESYLTSPYHKDILLTQIGPYLPIREQVNASQACRYLHTIFKPNLDKIHLLQAVIDDDRETVKRMLAVRPELLLADEPNVTWIESRLTWQRIRVEKPFTMAIKRGQLEMAQLLLPYFGELQRRGVIKDAAAEALEQWKISEVSAEEEKQKYARKIRALIDVIIKEDFPYGTEDDALIDRISEETELVLKTFRKELLPDGAIVLDNYVNVEQLFLSGFEAYSDYFYIFQNWNRVDLYCISVLGIIQSVFNPEWGQLFCEGLSSVYLANQSISKRAMSLMLENNQTSFYRSSRDANVGLGFDFFVNVQGGHQFSGPRDRWPNGWRYVKKIIQARAEMFNQLKAELESGYLSQFEDDVDKPRSRFSIDA